MHMAGGCAMPTSSCDAVHPSKGGVSDGAAAVASTHDVWTRTSCSPPPAPPAMPPPPLLPIHPFAQTVVCTSNVTKCTDELLGRAVVRCCRADGGCGDSVCALDSPFGNGASHTPTHAH